MISEQTFPWMKKNKIFKIQEKIIISTYSKSWTLIVMSNTIFKNIISTVKYENQDSNHH